MASLVILTTAGSAMLVTSRTSPRRSARPGAPALFRRVRTAGAVLSFFAQAGAGDALKRLIGGSIRTLPAGVNAGARAGLPELAVHRHAACH
jgi:hypothetical protein